MWATRKTADEKCEKERFSVIYKMRKFFLSRLILEVPLTKGGYNTINKDYPLL